MTWTHGEKNIRQLINVCAICIAGHWEVGVTHLASGERRPLEASPDESGPLLHPHHSDRDLQFSDILLQRPL